MVLRIFEETAVRVLGMASHDLRDSALRSLGYPTLRPADAPTAGRPSTAARDSRVPMDHGATVRRLKGVAIMATAVTVGAFSGLVMSHPVGSASQAVRLVTAGGAASGGSGRTVTPIDPFFDPNPGSGAGQGLAPAFGSGGGAPVFQSSGS